MKYYSALISILLCLQTEAASTTAVTPPAPATPPASLSLANPAARLMVKSYVETVKNMSFTVNIDTRKIVVAQWQGHDTLFEISTFEGKIALQAIVHGDPMEYREPTIDTEKDLFKHKLLALDRGTEKPEPHVQQQQSIVKKIDSYTKRYSFIYKLCHILPNARVYESFTARYITLLSHEEFLALKHELLDEQKTASPK